MARHRYDLTDAEWNIIEPLLPNKSRGVKRVDDRRCPQWHFLAHACGCAVGRYPGALRASHDLLQSFRSVAKSWRLGQASVCDF